VCRAVGNGALERAARLAAHGADTSPVLREWLIHTLRVFPPLATVRESAVALGRTSSTIRRVWRSEVGGSSPKEWLSWILLVRGIRLRSSIGPWDRVAASLGITRRTLERTAHRLVGRTPALAYEERQKVRRAFERYVRGILTRRPA